MIAELNNLRAIAFLFYFRSAYLRVSALSGTLKPTRGLGEEMQFGTPPVGSVGLRSSVGTFESKVLSSQVSFTQWGDVSLWWLQPSHVAWQARQASFCGLVLYSAVLVVWLVVVKWDFR